MNKIRNWMLAVLATVSLTLGGLVMTAPSASALSSGTCTINISGGTVTAYCPNIIYINGQQRWVQSFYAYGRCMNYFTRQERAIYGPTAYPNGTSSASCAWYEGVSSALNYVIYY